MASVTSGFSEVRKFSGVSPAGRRSNRSTDVQADLGTGTKSTRYSGSTIVHRSKCRVNGKPSVVALCCVTGLLGGHAAAALALRLVERT
jgi:hypothetical protein